MANTRAVRALWETELAEMRKTTAELGSFLSLLTPTGDLCAYMSVKGELSWSQYFDFFGQDGDDPRLDDFAGYVVARIQKAMNDSVENNIEYNEKILSAQEVVKKWIEQVLNQTLFIANSYWGAVHRLYYTDMDQVQMFKRSVVIPVTFSECFPRIHAWEMALPK
jgi:hypothetical protein